MRAPSCAGWLGGLAGAIGIGAAIAACGSGTASASPRDTSDSPSSATGRVADRVVRQTGPIRMRAARTASAAADSAITGQYPLGPARQPATLAVPVSDRRRSTAPAAAALFANRPPVISTVAVGSANATTGAVTATVRASDPNGDKLTYKATTSARGTVTITSSGVFTYTPSPAARHAASAAGAGASLTTDTVMITVTDSRGASTTRAVTVTVSAKNGAPLKPKVTVRTPNALTGVVTGTVTTTDGDQDPLTFSAASFTGKGTLAIDTGTGAFTYTPTAVARDNAAKTGAKATDKSDTFTVVISDGHGGTTTSAVTVTISPDALIGIGKAEKAPETHLAFDGLATDAGIIEVQTHLVVDRVPPVGLNFFAVQVDFPNQTWAHGGPQFNDGVSKLANWGGLVDRGGGSADYEQTDWSKDLLLIDCGEDKPNTVPWSWDTGREYILTVARGEQIVLPAGINTAHGNVMVPQRTMWVWNFTITPADGLGESFTSRLFDSADHIAGFYLWNESGYGSASDQQHAAWSMPLYRTQGTAGYQRPTAAWRF